jgi:hypothetical protein
LLGGGASVIKEEKTVLKDNKRSPSKGELPSPNRGGFLLSAKRIQGLVEFLATCISEFVSLLR